MKKMMFSPEAKRNFVSYILDLLLTLGVLSVRNAVSSPSSISEEEAEPIVEIGK
jgi:hypothetical protein